MASVIFGLTVPLHKGDNMEAKWPGELSEPIPFEKQYSTGIVAIISAQ